jgi:hypothetical protein
MWFLIPLDSSTANLLPSVDEATDEYRLEGRLLAVVQDSPEFVERETRPIEFPGAATNFVPSADEAMAQAPPGEAFEVQFAP